MSICDRIARPARTGVGEHTGIPSTGEGSAPGALPAAWGGWPGRAAGICGLRMGTAGQNGPKAARAGLIFAAGNEGRGLAAAPRIGREVRATARRLGSG
jgi:hypothetical protein